MVDVVKQISYSQLETIINVIRKEHHPLYSKLMQTGGLLHT